MGTINEAANLAVLLPVLCRVVREIVIVDDGSVDDTVKVARSFGAVVVERNRRLGIGSAIYAGFARSTCPFVATMDADLSHPPDALRVGLRLLDGGYDIVKFSRFADGSEWHATLSRRLALRLYGVALSLACGWSLRDPTNGFLMARRSCFAGETVFTDDPGEGWVPEFLARNRGRKIVEIPYIHSNRHEGVSHFGIRQEAARALRGFALGRSRPRPGTDASVGAGGHS